jgi:hypothetical protein
MLQRVELLDNAVDDELWAWRRRLRELHHRWPGGRMRFRQRCWRLCWHLHLWRSASLRRWPDVQRWSLQVQFDDLPEWLL